MSITLAIPDGTEQVVVSLAQFAVCRMVLDLEPDELDAFRRLLGLGPERIRALGDLADSQLQVERILAEPATSSPLPVVQDGRLVHPIACRRRILAERRNDPLPVCTWARDACGFVCTAADCGNWIGDETARGEFLASRFDAADKP